MDRSQQVEITISFGDLQTLLYQARRRRDELEYTKPEHKNYQQAQAICVNLERICVNIAKQLPRV